MSNELFYLKKKFNYIYFLYIYNKKKVIEISNNKY